jgi:hypothetical protein
VSLIVVQQNRDQRGAVSLTVVQQNRGIEDHCCTKKQGPLGCSKTHCSTAELRPRGTVRYGTSTRTGPYIWKYILYTGTVCILFNVSNPTTGRYEYLS